jgi:hypothetical protein
MPIFTGFIFEPLPGGAGSPQLFVYSGLELLKYQLFTVIISHVVRMGFGLALGVPMTDEATVFIAVSSLAASLVVGFVVMRVESASFMVGQDAVEAHQSLC